MVRVHYRRERGSPVISRTLAICLVVIALLAPAPSLATHTEPNVVSLGPDALPGSGPSNLGTASFDGRFVAFSSQADDLVAGDSNGVADVFVRDRLIAATRLVSTAGQVGDEQSEYPSISSDGSRVAFASYARNFVDPSPIHRQIYVKDLVTGALELTSLTSAGVPTDGFVGNPVISGDGTAVAFTASFFEGTESADDPIRAYHHDLETGATTELMGIETDVRSDVPWISSDGSQVGYVTFDDVGPRSVVVHDVATNSILHRVQMPEPGAFFTFLPLSADGSTIGHVEIQFGESGAERFHLIQVDIPTSEITRRSWTPPSSYQPNGCGGWRFRIAPDYSRVAFNQQGCTDIVTIHVADLDTGEVIETVQTTNFPGGNGNVVSGWSGDGSSLVYTSALGSAVTQVFIIDVTRSPFSDTGGSIFRDEIIWLADRGITRGCNSDGTLFCEGDFVTRGQMAAFLNRALDLEAAPDGDPFSDDAGIFEDDIEAVSAAGITLGCNDDRTAFCPDDLVTRGQMAAFINRALGLPASSLDRFVDDDTSIFEQDIQALAAVGITKGCTPDGTRFCPVDPVTRGQMAAFLQRALESP